MNDMTIITLPRRAFRAACVALSLAGACAPAFAATWGCSLTVTALNFGAYNPFQTTPNQVNGTISATCSLLTGNAATVTLLDTFSTGSSNSYATRTLVSGASTLNYNIYKDAAYTQIRGNGTGGSLTGSATLNLTTTNPVQSVSGTIYGQIPAGQNVAPGTYTDTMVVTLTF